MLVNCWLLLEGICTRALEQLEEGTRQTIKKLKQHKCIDTNPREVENRVVRMVEKFTIHNQLEKGERLRSLTDLFWKRHLSNTYSSVNHSILRLLMELSKDNLTKSVLLEDSIVNRGSKVRQEKLRQAAIVKKLISDQADEESLEDSPSEHISSEQTEEEDEDEEFGVRTSPDKKVFGGIKEDTKDISKDLESSKYTSTTTNYNHTVSKAGVLASLNEQGRSSNIFFGGFPVNIKSKPSLIIDFLSPSQPLQQPRYDQQDSSFDLNDRHPPIPHTLSRASTQMLEEQMEASDLNSSFIENALFSMRRPPTQGIQPVVPAHIG